LKYFSGSAHLSPADAGAAAAVMRAEGESAYHGIRRPRYAGYRYALPIVFLFIWMAQMLFMH